MSTMTKLVSLTVLVAAASAIGWWLVVNNPAEAVCLCPEGGPYNATAIHWGSGANCTQAENDLRTQTKNAATSDCGGLFQTCLGSLVITQSCYWHAGHGEYVVDGYMTYDCKECGPPIP